jgi:hypothetical protein
MGNVDNMPSDAEVTKMTNDAVNTPAPAKIDIGKKKGKWGEVYRHILTAKDRAEHKTGIPVEGWEPSNYEGPSRTYHDGRSNNT